MSGIQPKITRQPMKTGAADEKPRVKIKKQKQILILHIAVKRYFMINIFTKIEQRLETSILEAKNPLK